jgi:hypothetical protein
MSEPLVVRQLQQSGLDGRRLLRAEDLGLRADGRVGDVDRLLAAWRRRIEREGGAASAAAQLIGAGVGGDAHEPGPEVAATKRADVPVRGDECVLAGILGGGRRADHTEAEVEDRPLVQLDEAIECVKVAVARFADVRRLVVWRHGGCIARGRNHRWRAF